MKRSIANSTLRLMPQLALAVLASVIAFSVHAADDGKADVELGRKVFTQIAQPACGVCHTLQDAGTTGTIGANLHEIKPDTARVAEAVRRGGITPTPLRTARVSEAVRRGVGVMPPYEGKLTDEQIKAVAEYVARVAAK